MRLVRDALQTQRGRWAGSVAFLGFIPSALGGLQVQSTVVCQEL